LAMPWQFMGDDWLLSNRVFDTTDALLDHCCDGWNKLEAQPWTVMSLGLRDWIHRFKSLRYKSMSWRNSQRRPCSKHAPR
jgi:hypothetical protein